MGCGQQSRPVNRRRSHRQSAFLFGAGSSARSSEVNVRSFGYPRTQTHRTSLENGSAIMIRIVFLLRRKTGMSLAEFHRYWREQHGPLVAGHAQHIAALRYVQVHRLDDPINERMANQRGGMEPPY